MLQRGIQLRLLKRFWQLCLLRTPMAHQPTHHAVRLAALLFLACFVCLCSWPLRLGLCIVPGCCVDVLPVLLSVQVTFTLAVSHTPIHRCIDEHVSSQCLPACQYVGGSMEHCHTTVQFRLPKAPFHTKATCHAYEPAKAKKTQHRR